MVGSRSDRLQPDQSASKVGSRSVRLQRDQSASRVGSRSVRLQPDLSASGDAGQKCARRAAIDNFLHDARAIAASTTAPAARILRRDRGTRSAADLAPPDFTDGCAAITKEDHQSMSIGSTSVLAFAIACAPVTVALAQKTPTTSTPTQNGRTQSTPAQTPGSNLTRAIDGQRQFTPGRLVVPVTGTLGSTAASAADAPEQGGAAAVNGSFAIQRFARTTEGAVAAVGTLTLTITDETTSATRTIVTQAAMPLNRSTDTEAPEPSEPSAGNGATTSSATAPTTRSCETLRLVLGPIDIAPLGVDVQIERAIVDVTTLPGAGERLGALLCDVTSQITGAARPAELVNTLNALLDMLG
jgi:hypothetical protein